MNSQEIFDTVAKHLFTQGHQSKRAGRTTCAYRGEGSDMCAIGCMIPENMYDHKMEGKSVASIMMNYPEVGLLFANASLTMLKDLQTLHDNNYNWPKSYRYSNFTGKEQLGHSLREIALEYDLDTNVLTALGK